MINNSYHDHQNNTINNPPSIPYIDLRDAYRELERYQLIRGQLNLDDVSTKIFKSDSEQCFILDNNYCSSDILDKNTKTLIAKEFNYQDFTTFSNKSLNQEIFKSLHNYTIDCYKKSKVSSSSINNLNSIKEKIKEKIFGTQDPTIIIPEIKKYLLIIENLNATTIVGTLDFTDEISKYNLKYLHCSAETTCCTDRVSSNCSSEKTIPFLNTLSYFGLLQKQNPKIISEQIFHKLFNNTLHVSISQNKCQSLDPSLLGGKKVYRNMTKKGSQKKNRMRLLKRKTDSKYSHKLISAPHKRTHYRGNRVIASRKK